MTGVQTCALPIFPILVLRALPRKHGGGEKVRNALQADYPIEMMSGGALAIG